MLRKLNPIFGTLLAFWALGPTIGAAEDLLDIYQRALQNDPVVREAEATYLSALESRPQAKSQWLPSLSFNAGRSADRSTDPNRPTNFLTAEPSLTIIKTETERDSTNWNVNLNQVVFNWGLYVSLRQADKVVVRADADFEAVKQALLIRVSDAYFNVLAAEDSLTAQLSARESLARQLEQAQRRFEVGLIAVTDVQEAQAGYDLAIATVIEAEQTLASTQEILRAIIADHVTELAGPTQELPLVSPAPSDVEAWVDAAMEQNPSLVSSRIAADIAQDSIEIQRAARLPTLSFNTRYSESANDNLRRNFTLDGNVESIPTTSGPQGYSWSLNVTVPLYTGGLNESRIQQSVYQHRASMEALERVARETERQARDAYLRVLSEISRVKALRQAVESSRTALRATEAGFEVGTRTTVEVVASQNNLAQAETNYARSRYNYILNVLRLKQAAGNLSVPDIEEINNWLE
jgi:outer membrane protein